MTLKMFRKAEGLKGSGQEGQEGPEGPETYVKRSDYPKMEIPYGPDVHKGRELFKEEDARTTMCVGLPLAVN